MTNCIAVDLGASSYRIILNNGDSNIELYRATDHLVTINGIKYWSITTIYNAIIMVLDNIYDIAAVDSIAINSWGCDFVYLDQKLEYDDDNKLLSKIYGNCYINPTEIIGSDLITKKELFEQTAIKSQEFNTINRHRMIDRPITFIASYLNYLLTGHLEADYTIASTSQLLDKVKNQYNQQVLKKVNIDSSMLPPLVAAGSTIENIKIERFKQTKVIFGPGHDTAYALNHGKKDYLILNIGSWIIIGTNIDNVLNYNKNYSYERGLKSKYKVVINQIGMNGFNKLIEEAKLNVSYDELYKEMSNIRQTLKYQTSNETLDTVSYVDDVDIFIQLTKYLDTLAELTATNIKQFISDVNPKIKDIYIVGGGSENKFFIECLLNKIPTNIDYEFGPQEATVMGNIKYQREILDEIIRK